MLVIPFRGCWRILFAWGGHSAGQVSSTFAIVEFEDGTVHEIEPCNIRFVDNAMREYELLEREKNK